MPDDNRTFCDSCGLLLDGAFIPEYKHANIPHRVISPDGFDIEMDADYATLAEAEAAFDVWKKAYERQGYYSSNRGRIHLDDLKEECRFEPQYMDADQIKAAVTAGKTVHWSNDGYTVIKDKKGQYMIKCTGNGSCIGLTWQDEQTLNGKSEEFYIA